MANDEADAAGYMLSRQQRRIWSQDAPQAFRAVLSLRMRKPLAIKDAEGRWAVLADRHEILRTEIVLSRQSVVPMQRIHEGSLWRVEALASPPSPDELAQSPFGIYVARQGAGSRIDIVLPSLFADGPTLDLIGKWMVGLEDSSYESPRPAASTVCQYSDYAAWFDDELATAAPSITRQRRAAELDEAIKACSSLDRAPVALFQPRRVAREVEKERAAALRERCAAIGARPADLFLAAWQSLLWRLEGTFCQVLGLLVPGRSIAALAGAVGPYDHYVPQFVGPPTGRSFHELIARMRQAHQCAVQLASSFSWDDVGSRAGVPFLFGMHDLAEDRAFDTVDRYVISERFRLAIDVQSRATEFRVALNYNGSQFSTDAAARLLETFMRLLAILVERPESDPLAAPVTEPASVPVSPARGPASSRAPVSVSRTIERVAALSPGRIAITNGRRSVTYGVLNAESNRLARLLGSRCMRSGSGRVILALERGPELACAMLACLKAGAAFVPLDPALPNEHNAAIMGLVKADVIVVDGHDKVVAAPDGACVLDLRRDVTETEHEPDQNVERRTDEDGPAYIMFTSGSSGVPKGVVIGRYNLASYLGALSHVLEPSCEDRFLQTAPAGFSSAIRQYLLPLSAGACIVVASRDELLNPARLLTKLREQRVTVADLVPSYWRRILHAFQMCNDPRWGPLRMALSASEPLSADLARNLLRVFPPGVAVINMYGQTETAGIVACHRFNPDEEVQDPVPIGRPLPGSTIVVVDEAGHRALPNQRGELVVTGPTVGLGYLDSFTPDTYRFVRERAGSPIATFRTGDIGREEGNGVLTLWGRVDDRVKIRGHRVDPAHVERHIAAHLAVEQTIVVPREHLGETELVAHIVPRSDLRLTRAEIVTHLETSLPGYLIPSRIFFHDVLPSTPNGKIDRLALKSAAASATVADGDRLSIDQRLAGLWSEVLRCGPVSRDDNFFSLGGQSLVGIDLLAKVAEEFLVDLPWQVLYDAPTVSELAARIANKLNAGKPPL